MSTKAAAASKASSSRPPSTAWRGGFAITSMAMWDADAPRGASMFWSSTDFVSSSGVEQVATLPASVLRCRAVTRRMAFSTVDAIEALRVVQTVFLHGARLEQWTFDCGFVIPGCVCAQLEEDYLWVAREAPLTVSLARARSSPPPYTIQLDEQLGSHDRRCAAGGHDRRRAAERQRSRRERLLRRRWNMHWRDASAPVLRP